MTAPAGETATSRVRDLLLRAGFARVGFARAGRAPHAERFEEWLRDGHAADMHYLARNAARRLDPRRVVDGARTVIVVALHYRGGAGGDEPVAPDRAVISSYARGTDYHRVIETRLRDACRRLAAEFEGERFRYYVDTGPVLERAWAERAGVGWIGKNACVIDPVAGSYFFLGAVITTLELEPDPPATDHCATCRLCVDACPTNAIVGPYRVDSSRCISYQTIENRGAVPVELREHLGNLVFGCDICQDVCPFNQPEWSRRHAAREGGGSAPDPELDPRPENVAPSLRDLATLDDADAFRRRFPRSAVRRARFPGFLRNVIIAIGNSGDPDFAPLLDDLASRGARGDAVLEESVRWARERLRADAAGVTATGSEKP